MMCVYDGLSFGWSNQPDISIFHLKGGLIFAIFGDFNSAGYKRLLVKKYQSNCVEFSPNFLYNWSHLSYKTD